MDFVFVNKTDCLSMFYKKIEILVYLIQTFTFKSMFYCEISKQF